MSAPTPLLCSTTSDALYVANPDLAPPCSLVAINVAAELAAARSSVQGPNTFRSALIDECYNLTADDVLKHAKVRRV